MSSVIRRSSSTIYLNIFFSETTDENVIKVGTDAPYEFLFQNCYNKSNAWKNSGCHGSQKATKETSLKIFFSKTAGQIIMIFGRNGL